MGPKDSNPPKYTGQLLRLYYSRLKSGLSKKLFEKRRISAGDRETGILPGDGRRGVEEHAPVGGFQHGQIVVGISDGHDLETHGHEAENGFFLSVSLTQNVVFDIPFPVDFQGVAQKRGMPQLF